jgi:hypothetical protein
MGPTISPAISLEGRPEGVERSGWVQKAPRPRADEPATGGAIWPTLEGGRSRLELGLLGEPVFEHVTREADVPPDATAELAHDHTTRLAITPAVPTAPGRLPRRANQSRGGDPAREPTPPSRHREHTAAMAAATRPSPRRIPRQARRASKRRPSALIFAACQWPVGGLSVFGLELSGPLCELAY